MDFPVFNQKRTNNLVLCNAPTVEQREFKYQQVPGICGSVLNLINTSIS